MVLLAPSVCAVTTLPHHQREFRHRGFPYEIHHLDNATGCTTANGRPRGVLCRKSPVTLQSELSRPGVRGPCTLKLYRRYAGKRQVLLTGAAKRGSLPCNPDNIADILRGFILKDPQHKNVANVAWRRGSRAYLQP